MSPEQNASVAAFFTLLLGHVALAMVCLVVVGLVKGYMSLRHATKEQIVNVFLGAACVTLFFVVEFIFYMALYQAYTGHLG